MGDDPGWCIADLVNLEVPVEPIAWKVKKQQTLADVPEDRPAQRCARRPARGR